MVASISKFGCAFVTEGPTSRMKAVEINYPDHRSENINLDMLCWTGLQSWAKFCATLHACGALGIFLLGTNLFKGSIHYDYVQEIFSVRLSPQENDQRGGTPPPRNVPSRNIL